MCWYHRKNPSGSNPGPFVIILFVKIKEYRTFLIIALRTFKGYIIPGGPQKNGTVDTVDFQDFALINSFFFPPGWIEQLFFIENFSFHE